MMRWMKNNEEFLEGFGKLYKPGRKLNFQQSMQAPLLTVLKS